MDRLRFVPFALLLFLLVVALTNTATATVYNNRTGTSYTTIRSPGTI